MAIVLRAQSVRLAAIAVAMLVGPVLAMAATGVTSQESAGWRSNCAVSTDGSVQCWGLNDSGQLGDNTTTTRFAPVDVHGNGNSDLLSSVATVAAGYQHACALTSAGGVK